MTTTQTTEGNRIMTDPTRKMFTLDITLGGVTKTVTVEGHRFRDSEVVALDVPGAVAQIGRGVAHYPTMVRLVKEGITGPAIRVRPGYAVDTEGGVWRIILETVVRNRPALVVGWDTETMITNDSTNAKVVRGPIDSDVLSERDAILKALRTSWRSYLGQTAAGTATEHMAIQRAANYASRNHETQTTAWYAAAINHYMDR